jgi:acetyl-CoA carboxylase biotin carboxyl carrier protein
MKMPDMRELRSIVDWVNETEDVRELSVRCGETELHISRNHKGKEATIFRETPLEDPHALEPFAALASTVSVAPAAPTPASSGSAAKALAADQVLVKSSMVGTFFTAPQAGGGDFVSVGDQISEGTVLGIVEVVRIMNNVEADVSGEVISILVENEQPVEFGQPLAVIQRAA